ncbi:MAG: hypothetical protein EOP06_09005 [Proteobacteria bacterium]|nr:MAG: hypothetical protein EOP06_09005 [Pseudomonadota bacterium]
MSTAKFNFWKNIALVMPVLASSSIAFAGVPEVIEAANQDLISMTKMAELYLKIEVLAERSESIIPGHSSLSLQTSENHTRLTLKYDQEAEAHPELLTRTITTIYGLTNPNKNQFSTLAAANWLELKANALAGSPAAIARLSQLELANLESGAAKSAREKLKAFTSATDASLDQQRERDTAELTEQTQVLVDRAIAFQKAREKEFTKWKQETKALENYEQQDKRLNDLVLANDRAGVRKMIEAYLPWPLMEPVERNLWHEWLEAIEFPRADKKITVYRGLDFKTDKVQRGVDPSGQPRFGFFSPMLTKNQGSYTRRLRSLATSRLATGDWKAKDTAARPFATVKISDQLRAHATEPKGSMFLSFTTNLDVARGFSGIDGGGLLAVSVDARRMFPNSMSPLFYESEYLAPLIIFPDEVVAIVEHTNIDGKYREYDRFIALLPAKTSAFDSTPEADGVRAASFKTEGISFMPKLFSTKSAGKSCLQVLR